MEKYFLIEDENDIEAIKKYLANADEYTRWGTCDDISFLERGGLNYHKANLPFIMQIQGHDSFSMFGTKSEWLPVRIADEDTNYKYWKDDSTKDYYGTTFEDDLGYKEASNGN